MKKIILLVIGVLFLSGCANVTSTNEIDGIKFEEVKVVSNKEKNPDKEKENNTEEGKAEIPENATNYVKFDMNTGSSFIIELDPEAAPITVANFKKLVSEGFYDGLTIHRITDAVIQGGDPDGNGTGGSEDTIVGEFYRNTGEKNPISHERGAISMARSNDFNSASSQFFIVYKDATYYDGEYATFGKVIAGMDTVDAISKINVENETPKVKPVITKAIFVTIEK